MTTDSLAPQVKPLLRGVLHQGAFFVAVVIGVLVTVYAEGTRATVGALIFAASVVGMLGASTLYHRVTWTPPMRLRMRRLDHAGIYLLIAGTYTPVALMVVHGTTGRIVLAVVWCGSLAAIALKFLWDEAPKWLSAVIALALGWVGIFAMPQVWSHAGAAAVVLLGIGGLAYTIGALVYAFRRPQLRPEIFGYHELFHALTLVAVACQYVAIAFFVLHVG
jgi:hemolysin III